MLKNFAQNLKVKGQTIRPGEQTNKQTDATKYINCPPLKTNWKLTVIRSLTFIVPELY